MCEILNRLYVCEQSNEALNFQFLSYLKMLKFWTKYHFSGKICNLLKWNIYRFWYVTMC